MTTFDTLPLNIYDKVDNDPDIISLWKQFWKQDLPMDGDFIVMPESFLERAMDRMLILAEYPELWRRICLDNEKKSLGCAIIGTPGIGTLFPPLFSSQCTNRSMRQKHFPVLYASAFAFFWPISGVLSSSHLLCLHIERGLYT